MAQLSEKLPAILKTTKEQRRFVPESEVERLLDEASKRIKAESNDLLAQQAASAHLLKYKAKKGRRLAAHLRLQNDRLKQAVEDEQAKFAQLKEALRRRTEQYDKLRLTHMDMEGKVKRLEEKLKRQPSAGRVRHGEPLLQDGLATQGQMLQLPPPVNGPGVRYEEMLAQEGRGPPAKRAKTPLGTTRPNAGRASYKFRPSSAPGGHAAPDDQPGQPFDDERLRRRVDEVDEGFQQEDYQYSVAEDEEDMPPPSFGTTPFAEQNNFDSSGHSGQETTDAEDGRSDEESHAPHHEEAYDHFPTSSREEATTEQQQSRFQEERRHSGGNTRPSSSPVKRSGGIPPLHGGASSVQNRSAASSNTRSQGQQQTYHDAAIKEGEDNRPSTAPEEMKSYRQQQTNEDPSFSNEFEFNNDNQQQQSPEVGGKGEEEEDVDPEDRENAEIDQFLDEGDRLRPKSAKVDPKKKNEKTKKKTVFFKRQPKKRDNALAAVENARKLREEKEAQEQMSMMALKKTWLRAIVDEPLQEGIDRYIYTKKRKWVVATICQGFQCQGSAVRRHGCFGLTLIGAMFLGFLRSYGSNKAFGYYNAAAEFCIIALGLTSFFGMYHVVVVGSTLKRLMSYAFSERRTRSELQNAEFWWKWYVVRLQLGVGALMAGFAALTVISAAGKLEGLDLFMIILGTPGLVWFTVLTIHFFGLFWFSNVMAIQFIRKNNPMSKKKDPNVEDYFRIRRIVQTMSEAFGANLVVPHSIICLIGLSSCVAGLSTGKAQEVSLELLLLGGFFATLLYNILSIGGGLTAELDTMFKDRTMHSLELLKANKETFKTALLDLSSSGTNDILCTCCTLFFLFFCSLIFFFFLVFFPPQNFRLTRSLSLFSLFSSYPPICKMCSHFSRGQQPHGLVSYHDVFSVCNCR